MGVGRFSSGRRAVVAGVLAFSVGIGVPAVTLVAGFALGILDPLRRIDNPVTAAAAARRAAVAAEARLPALTDLTAALTHGPAGWSGSGGLTAGASLPTVTACVPSPITPVVTVSRAFTVASAQVTVTLAGYVAGAGGPVFDAQQGGIPACAVPGGSSSVQPGAPDGPGVARFVATTSQDGVVTSTQVWRRGDVIAYLSGADPTTEVGLAGTMDQALTRALGSDCVDQHSLATDNVRDPFAVAMRSDFKGLTVDEGINQSPTPLPSPTVIPVTATPAAATSSDPAASSPGASATAAPVVAVSQGPLGVLLPAQPVAATPSKPPWPVYPPLPTATPVPVPPSAPASVPPTHAPLREPQVDSLGPGCGWAFTGMLPPTPPVVLSAAALSAKQASLQPLLARDQAAWQLSVNAYWVAYTNYLGQAQAYAGYTDQVNQVSAAWAVIDGNWQTYFTLKAAYDQMVTDHNQFLKDQAAAQAGYDSNQATCTPGAGTVPADPAAPADPATAAPADASAPHARSAASPADSPSPSPSASGGGLLPTAPVASASASPTSSATATAAPTETTAPPVTDAPTAEPPASSSPAPTPIGGTPCESPPAILAQTAPPLPGGPPPTKPADPRPKASATQPSPSPSATR